MSNETGSGGAGGIYVARSALGRLQDWAATVEIPGVTRLANTIDRWSNEVLPQYRTGRASSGPAEAVNGESEQFDRAARGFRNYQLNRARMLLKTAVSWQTPPTPRIQGRAGRSDPAHAVIA